MFHRLYLKLRFGLRRSCAAASRLASNSEESNTGGAALALPRLRKRNLSTPAALRQGKQLKLLVPTRRLIGIYSVQISVFILNYAIFAVTSAGVHIINPYFALIAFGAARALIFPWARLRRLQHSVFAPFACASDISDAKAYSIVTASSV